MEEEGELDYCLLSHNGKRSLRLAVKCRARARERELGQRRDRVQSKLGGLATGSVIVRVSIAPDTEFTRPITLISESGRNLFVRPFQNPNLANDFFGRTNDRPTEN